MKNEDKHINMNLTSLEDLITEDFGEIGSPERDQFEMECDAFVIGEQLKEERVKAGLKEAGSFRAGSKGIGRRWRLHVTQSRCSPH